MTLSDDNRLLRLAYVEVVRPNRSTRWLLDSRKDIEKRLVAFLGQNPSEKEGAQAETNCDENAIKTKDAFTLHQAMKDYARQVCAHVQASPLTGPISLQPPVTDVLVPFNNGFKTREEKTLLLRRLILSGLVKGYRLAS